MIDTRNSEEVAAALIELTGLLNSPKQDGVLMRAAGVSLDRALFPLLARLGARPSMGVAELAESAGRDPSTVSRQIAKLEALGLVERPASAGDQRVRAARITPEGARTVRAITAARRRLLGEILASWTAAERKAFPSLLRKFSRAMKTGMDKLSRETR